MKRSTDVRASIRRFRHELTEEGVMVVWVDVTGMPACMSCHTVGYRGEKYCPQCGTEFRSHPPAQRRAYHCPRCFQPVVHPVAFYCTSCGESLAPHPFL